MKDLFEEKVLKVLAHIPIGCVATYGQIAQLIGYPRHARQVGGRFWPLLKRLWPIPVIGS